MKKLILSFTNIFVLNLFLVHHLFKELHHMTGTEEFEAPNDGDDDKGYRLRAISTIHPISLLC